MQKDTQRNLKVLFFVVLWCQIFFIYPSYGTENFSRLKCKFKKYQTCEKCDEDSKIFYEIENKKLCTRCTLGYLSYYFSSQTMKEVKVCNNTFLD